MRTSPFPLFNPLNIYLWRRKALLFLRWNQRRSRRIAWKKARKKVKPALLWRTTIQPRTSFLRSNSLIMRYWGSGSVGSMLTAIQSCRRSRIKMGFPWRIMRSYIILNNLGLLLKGCLGVSICTGVWCCRGVRTAPRRSLWGRSTCLRRLSGTECLRESTESHFNMPLNLVYDIFILS